MAKSQIGTSEETRKYELLLSHLQVIHEGNGLVEANVFALPTGASAKPMPKCVLPNPGVPTNKNWDLHSCQ
jgi:hypothetical protein